MDGPQPGTIPLFPNRQAGNSPASNLRRHIGRSTFKTSTQFWTGKKTARIIIIAAITPLMMRFLSILVLFLSSIAATAAGSQLVSTEVLYWPVSYPQPSVLARVSYDPQSSKPDLISYSPPSSVDEFEAQDLVRVGLYVPISTNSRQWVGTLTSLSALKGDTLHKPTLRLHIGVSNEIYHVSLVSSSETTATSTSGSDKLLVELIREEAGPRPQLNRPVVVGPDGKNPEEIPEKTLIQKYWWVFLIITFLVMSGGGEGGQ